MSSYKCCVLDSDNRIASLDIIESDGDLRAMVQAAELIVRKYASFSAIEVWSDAKCIGRIANPRLPAVNRM